ncbi:16S rRNA (guanine(966)-N(2))-methyltransferase RsmD [Entomospira entomophila]|uniref:16S rRNA (Guanine(966)-N(2))-methyltransferase RsmD n=1 Tax=Entomospira entomophila TaxID=2719988 RepID=A0A968G9U8_9SPIO|nr:16S rRNA (guanine(966)-N(2))-methyltransferase RsmD [Entomospira entomophilus]NIZ41187.1 16S rRNA (guanine(966)-N(2))-methyltransferase RsmD [Entomospira entomophilus]WDI35394.1 16S rRNA (guanine(966)-N(2))-methyltransferase RsmD [Entomospira entomophilus]
MRITGGEYRSRRVKMPPGVIRPAMDRMRESMFAIHMSHYGGSLEGLSFLDLFSGSGIVALEAASRGCHRIVLVEKDGQKRPTIMENLQILDDEIQSKLYLMSVEKFIRQPSFVETFDLIHLDPPFPLSQKFSYIQDVAKKRLLTDNGTLTIHYPKEDVLVELIDDLQCIDVRSYGQSQLAFYRRVTSPA